VGYKVGIISKAISRPKTRQKWTAGENEAIHFFMSGRENVPPLPLNPVGLGSTPQKSSGGASQRMYTNVSYAVVIF
jgi:hypothetical protein